MGVPNPAAKPSLLFPQTHSRFFLFFFPHRHQVFSQLLRKNYSPPPTHFFNPPDRWASTKKQPNSLFQSAFPPTSFFSCALSHVSPNAGIRPGRSHFLSHFPAIALPSPFFHRSKCVLIRPTSHHLYVVTATFYAPFDSSITLYARTPFLPHS